MDTLCQNVRKHPTNHAIAYQVDGAECSVLGVLGVLVEIATYAFGSTVRVDNAH